MSLKAEDFLSSDASLAHPGYPMLLAWMKIGPGREPGIPDSLLHLRGGRDRVTPDDRHQSGNLLREGGVRDGVSTGISRSLRCRRGGLDRAWHRRLVAALGRRRPSSIWASWASWRRSRWSGPRSAGATYADIRINRYRSQDVSLRVQADRATGKPVEVPSVSDSGSFGFGLRVLADGAWGFSASHEVTREAIARAAAEAVEIARANAPLRLQPIQLAATPSYRDTYRTKIVTDPFSVPIEQKLELLRAVAAEARKVAGVFSVIGLDRRPPRGPVLRLDRGERDRAARLPDLARVHRHGRPGRPQGQVAHLPAARRLRRLRGRRAGRHARPGAPGRRRGGRAPEGALGLARRQGPRAPADPPGR